MTTVLPIGLKNYLGNKKVKLPKGFSSQFYISWEDGLWDIIRSFSIENDSLILVPDFFCVDVINNMKDHGLKVEYYPVDRDLQPDRKQLLKVIKSNNPKILVLFHPVGITNNCINKKFLNQLPKNIVVIEDSVHRIVDHSQININRDNYFCMTSLRKVVPLQGSFVYGKSSTIRKLHGADKNTFSYSYSIIFLWICMQIMASTQYLTRSIQPLNRVFGNLAEAFMKQGYEIIGDHNNPGYSLSYFKDMYEYIDHQKIRSIKRDQEKIYKDKLINSISTHLYIPKYADHDRGELRGFPIILEGNNRNIIIEDIRKKGLFIRSELEGCPWTKTRSIIYLPMGPYLSTTDILHIVTTVKNCLN